METLAPKKIYVLWKNVPLERFPENLPEFLVNRCNALIMQGCLLCEVNNRGQTASLFPIANHSTRFLDRRSG